MLILVVMILLVLSIRIVKIRSDNKKLTSVYRTFWANEWAYTGFINIGPIVIDDIELGFRASPRRACEAEKSKTLKP